MTSGKVVVQMLGLLGFAGGRLLTAVGSVASSKKANPLLICAAK